MPMKYKLNRSSLKKKKKKKEKGERLKIRGVVLSSLIIIIHFFFPNGYPMQKSNCKYFGGKTNDWETAIQF